MVVVDMFRLYAEVVDVEEAGLGRLSCPASVVCMGDAGRLSTSNWKVLGVGRRPAASRLLQFSEDTR